MPPFLNASGAVTGSTECGRARWTTSSERVFTAEFFRTGIIAGSVFVVFGYHGSKLGIRTCVGENRYVWWDDFILIMFHIYYADFQGCRKYLHCIYFFLIQLDIRLVQISEWRKGEKINCRKI